MVLEGDDAELEVTILRSMLLGLKKREDIRFLFNPRLLNDEDEILGPLTIESGDKVLRGVAAVPARLKLEPRSSGDGGDLTFSPMEGDDFPSVTISLRTRTDSANGAPEEGEPAE